MNANKKYFFVFIVALFVLLLLYVFYVFIISQNTAPLPVSTTPPAHVLPPLSEQESLAAKKIVSSPPAPLPKKEAALAKDIVNQKHELAPIPSGEETLVNKIITQ